MLKGGVIMDVTTAVQAKIAEEAGAVSVMSLERVPADIRAEGGVARMADPPRIKEIMAAVTVPKSRDTTECTATFARWWKTLRSSATKAIQSQPEIRK